MKKYAQLCRKVEETAGVSPTTPKQFEDLSESIFRLTGKRLSPTTLKRIWGYIDEPLMTRRSTLDILAQFCGWSDYEEFEKGDMPEVESGRIGTKLINVERDVKKGDRIRILWQPSRVCVISYCGNRRWEIIEAEGTKLLRGDTFSCSIIAEGEPLYLDNLVHEGEASGVYVCGRRNGIRFLKEN